MLPALLALIGTVIQIAPEIITDIEKLLADAKASPSITPIAPGVTADMAALEAKLVGK